MERWIVERQEDDGSWGGIQPPWVWSLIALSLRGYGLDHEVMQKGLDGLEQFTIREGDTRRLEACQSPVWDTALAVIALSDAGLPADDPAIERGSAWLLDQEVTHRGDWGVRRKNLRAGGWAFEFGNDWYPDIDDTAEVVLALRRAVQTPQLEASMQARDRLDDRMASRNGAWGAFDADNVRALVRRLPFCDFGEVIDPPSSDVTAHVVEMLARERCSTTRGCAAASSSCWRNRSRTARGSAAGVRTTSTAPAPPCPRSSRPASARSIRRSAARWRGSSACRTTTAAGARTALVHRPGVERPRRVDRLADRVGAARAARAGEQSEALMCGADFLVRTQLPDGGWDEPWYTGTGFPGDFYINYHLYRLVFPVSALGRIVNG
jgi:Squalene cyclase